MWVGIDHFGCIEQDDRRFVFLRVSCKHRGNHDYFKKLHEAINDPAQLGAFVHRLATHDITNFNFRSKPNTGELLEQKLQSLKGFARYWFEVLSVGYIDCARPTDRFEVWEGSQFVSSVHLSEGYRQHLSKSKQHQTVQNTEIKRGFSKWCPEANYGRKKLHGKQERGYQLPSLDQARVAFEVAIGGKIDWDNEKE